MAIYHSVILKLKQGTTEAQMQAIVEGLRALTTEIPEVKQLGAGLNFTDRNQGYQVGLTVVLDRKEDISAYFNHPAHLKVVKETVQPNLEDILVLDYEG